MIFSSRVLPTARECSRLAPLHLPTSPSPSNPLQHLLLPLFLHITSASPSPTPLTHRITSPSPSPSTPYNHFQFPPSPHHFPFPMPWHTTFPPALAPARHLPSPRSSCPILWEFGADEFWWCAGRLPQGPCGLQPPKHEPRVAPAGEYICIPQQGLAGRVWRTPRVSAASQTSCPTPLPLHCLTSHSPSDVSPPCPCPPISLLSPPSPQPPPSPPLPAPSPLSLPPNPSLPLPHHPLP